MSYQVITVANNPVFLVHMEYIPDRVKMSATLPTCDCYSSFEEFSMSNNKNICLLKTIVLRFPSVIILNFNFPRA